jgi:hypothetical protein
MSRVAHFSVTTLSDAAGGERFPSLAVTLAYVRACGGDLAEWEARWRSAAAEVSAGSAAEVTDGNGGRCPYVGLVAFQPGDAGRFFGRDRVVAALAERVLEHRFVGVFGASGSGKSSVLRAGLAAKAMADGLSGDGGAQPTVVFTPGPHPMEECAVALAGLGGAPPAVLHAELTASTDALHLRVRQTLAERPGTDLLLIVDQFEEVFTLCRDTAERAVFIAALLRAADPQTGRTRVVLGVRADFYGHCGQYAELAEALNTAQFLIGPMTTEELTQAITRPARHAGCLVDTALVARMVSDATGQPSALPLASHALVETWRRRQGSRLTLAGYEAAGGIHHAVAHTAEHVYSRLSHREQDAARQIFLRLTALADTPEPTKRRATRQELDTDNPDIDSDLRKSG